ncbi:MAG: ArsC family (seleno)protein [Gemmatales bacterium]|nr:ArsC family (seleno)protein [Gemmatales bacterium]
MQEFLARHNITAREIHDAKKQPLSPEQALALLRQAQVFHIAKGKKVIRYDLKQEKPNKEELKKLLAGPTGNLRAPTFRVGQNVLVGFDEATCRQLFGV